MKKVFISVVAGLAGLSLLSVAGLLSGCEVGSADAVINQVGINYSGYYDAVEGSTIAFVTPANSGNLVTSFNLRQDGSQLEAIDNNNQIFRGSINNVNGSVASFVLEGATTIGRNVTIAGTLTGEGSSAIIEGTWVEPNTYCRLYGDASINAQTTTPTQVATPVMSPASQVFTNSITVSITCSTAGASIYYTTDGSTPSSSSTLYSQALPFTVDTTLKAIGILSGFTSSDVATETYDKQ